ncbi:MAG: hypothetical protein KDD63_16980, partial [Bacteroidetes bacterium]|nr:hypothetical protein [Bacteroidota bacterium]
MSPFDELTPFERGGIEAKVLETLEQKAAAAEYSTGSNAGVEIAVLEKLKGYFQAVIDETFSLEGDLLALSGFEKVGFETAVSIDVTNNTLFGGSTGKIFDFAGISYEGELIRTAAQSAYTYTDSLFPFDPPALIFTSDNMTFNGGLNQADSLYENLSFDYILWLHFDTSKDSVYYKTRTNISAEEAQAFVDAYYQYSMQEYWDEGNLYGYEGDPPIAARDRVQTSGARNNTNGDINCTDADCGSIKKWKAYCCLLSEAMRDPENLEAFSPVALNLGALCGLIDGLYETINIIYSLGKGLIEAADHVPLTLFWFIDIYESCRREGDFFKGLSEKINEDKKFAEKIWGTLSLFYANRGLIWNEIQKSIGTFFDNLNPLTGLASTGYSVGKVLFEVLWDYFTGGSVTIFKNGAKLTRFSKEAFEMLAGWGKKSAKGIVEDIVEVGLKQA